MEQHPQQQQLDQKELLYQQWQQRLQQQKQRKQQQQQQQQQQEQKQGTTSSAAAAVHPAKPSSSQSPPSKNTTQAPSAVAGRAPAAQQVAQNHRQPPLSSPQEKKVQHSLSPASSSTMSSSPASINKTHPTTTTQQQQQSLKRDQKGVSPTAVAVRAPAQGAPPQEKVQQSSQLPAPSSSGPSINKNQQAKTNQQQKQPLKRDEAVAATGIAPAAAAAHRLPPPQVVVVQQSSSSSPAAAPSSVALAPVTNKNNLRPQQQQQKRPLKRELKDKNVAAAIAGRAPAHVAQNTPPAQEQRPAPSSVSTSSLPNKHSNTQPQQHQTRPLNRVKKDNELPAAAAGRAPAHVAQNPPPPAQEQRPSSSLVSTSLPNKHPNTQPQQQQTQPLKPEKKDEIPTPVAASSAPAQAAHNHMPTTTLSSKATLIAPVPVPATTVSALVPTMSDPPCEYSPPPPEQELQQSSSSVASASPSINKQKLLKRVVGFVTEPSHDAPAAALAALANTDNLRNGNNTFTPAGSEHSQTVKDNWSGNIIGNNGSNKNITNNARTTNAAKDNISDNLQQRPFARNNDISFHNSDDNQQRKQENSHGISSGVHFKEDEHDNLKVSAWDHDDSDDDSDIYDDDVEVSLHNTATPRTTNTKKETRPKDKGDQFIGSNGSRTNTYIQAKTKEDEQDMMLSCSSRISDSSVNYSQQDSSSSYSAAGENPDSYDADNPRQQAPRRRVTGQNGEKYYDTDSFHSADHIKTRSHSPTRSDLISFNSDDALQTKSASKRQVLVREEGTVRLSHGNRRSLIIGREPTATVIVSEDEVIIEEDEEESPGCCYTFFTSSNACHSFLTNWPRTSSLLLGVAIPMFVQIFISILCGALVANYEKILEVRNNDETLKAIEFGKQQTQVVTDVAALLPKLCLNMYWLNISDTSEAVNMFKDLVRTMKTQNASTYFDDNPAPFSNSAIMVNTTTMDQWMFDCGKAADTLLIDMLQSVDIDLSDLENAMTFNWIRCRPGTNDIAVGDWMGSVDITQMQPHAQRMYYSNSWKESQLKIYQETLDNYTANGVTGETAQLNAYDFSLDAATGVSGCSVNSPAAGWFWFAVQTTIGYGNQAPITESGRAVVNTLGFLSILIFGGILAAGGVIASSVFDDTLIRLHLDILTTPFWSCLIWGFGYYSWMALIAWVTVQWKRNRLGETEFGMKDGYWFAFISSTTIGFGDIYLQPEVIIGVDMITFPILFLVAFIFFAAFIGKFTKFVTTVGGCKRSLIEDLMTNLKQTDNPYADAVGPFIDAIENTAINVTHAVGTTAAHMTHDVKENVERTFEHLRSHGEESDDTDSQSPEEDMYPRV